MSNYVPPGDLADGVPVTGTIWNALKNGIASFLNNSNLGDGNISANPAERIAGSKVDLGSGVLASAHHTRHEPGGADEVQDIDILNTGTIVSAHASRHASGGADPLPAGSISPSMLQSGAVPDSLLASRKDAETFLAKAFGLTFTERGKLSFTHPNATADPRSAGIIRSGKVYFACPGIDSVTQLDPTTGTFTNIQFPAGDAPRAICLIGSDIYVAINGDGGAIKPKIKKIDSNNVITTICDITTDGAGKITAANGVRYLVPSPDGTILYALVYAAAVLRWVARISVTPTSGVLHSFDAGAAAVLSSLYYVKAGSNDYVVCLDNGTDATKTMIRRLAAADLTGSTTVLTASNKNAATQGVYDGSMLIIWDIGATAAIRIWDVASTTMVEAANVGIPTNVPTVGTAPQGNSQPAFFDGRAAYFATDTTSSTIMVIRAGIYSSAYNIRVTSVGAKPVQGFATDGINLWCGLGNTAFFDRICLA